MTIFRVYETVGSDGYPPEWHALPSAHGTWDGIKHIVRERAGHRCIRCGHPYMKGAGEWSPCDEKCSHGAPIRYRWPGADWSIEEHVASGWRDAVAGADVEAQWRILTVHHLNGKKADCRWWNLAALCQRCHLRVQRVVVMPRIWPWPHSDWFKPYAAGYYASVYLGEELSRENTEARLDELLALEAVA